MLDFDELTDKLYSIVSTIRDTDIRAFTLRMLHAAPKSFWTGSASRHHHMEDERGKFGNLLHTIRVAKLARMLCDVGSFSTMQTDIVTSAAVLHDVCRHGVDGTAERSVKEHPKLVRKLAKEHRLSCTGSNAIFRIVEVHMGKWGIDPYVPALSMSSVVHIADVVIARFAEVIEHA